jgi:hypothetical protein
MASYGRADWEAIGQAAILDLLGDVFFAPWTEVESRISNRGWKDFRRVQPVQLSGARRKLRESGAIIEETSKTTPPVHGIRLPYPENRKRELQRLAGKRRKLYRKYLSWAAELPLCGKHAEHVIWESLTDSSSDAGLYVPPQVVGEEDVPVAVEFRDGGPGVIVTSLRR